MYQLAYICQQVTNFPTHPLFLYASDHIHFQCGGTTHVLRLDWSPDAHYLVSAHAMNNNGPTAQIVDRDGWSTGMDFVGHRKAVTCVVCDNNIVI